MDDIVSTELEALQHTYDIGDPSIVQKDDGTREILLEMFPRDIKEEHKCFCSASLLIVFPPSYPDSPPIISITSSTGIDKPTLSKLEAVIHNTIDFCHGELLLGIIWEEASDFLLLHNTPTGTCSICLHHLNATTSSSSNGQITPHVAKLPTCSHCFHMYCFSAWYLWQQRAMEVREEQAIEELGGLLAPEKLKEEGVVREDGGPFIVLCPMCRAKNRPSDIERCFGEALGAASLDAWVDG
jgi:hypothetical protein